MDGKFVVWPDHDDELGFRLHQADIDANETPIEADEHAITNGTARAIPLKDFGIMRIIG